MEMISVVSLEESSLVPALLDTGKKLDGAGIEIVLDFSLVGRLDSHCLRAIEEFSCRADEKETKVTLRGVNAEMYKTLKLAKLTRMFSFLD